MRVGWAQRRWVLLVHCVHSAVVYLYLSSSSDEHHLLHSCLLHRHAGWNVKQVLSLSCIFGSFGVLGRFLLLLVCWWEQYHDTATSGTDYSDLRKRDNFCSACVGKHVYSITILSILCKTLRRKNHSAREVLMLRLSQQQSLSPLRKRGMWREK